MTPTRVGLAVLVLGLMAVSFLAGVGFESRFSALGGPGHEVRFAQFPGDVFADESALQSLQAKDANNLTPVETFWQVLNKVRERYYEPIDDENKLAYGAAKGLMRALGDPYSRFLDPKDRMAFDRATEGQVEGIGALLAPGEIPDVDVPTVVIVKPFPGGPAYNAGILPGDWVVGVGDSPEKIDNVIGETVDEVADRIRGPHGTEVYLMVVRDRKSDPITIKVARDRVEVPVVQTQHFDNIAYAKLDSFSENSAQRLGEALSDLEKQPESALIIDLRGNSGGLLNAAQDIVSMFVSQGPVVYIKEREGNPKQLPIKSELYRGYSFPIVVLVNSTTASASEILAGALKDNKRATLVGTRTFGKGLVQTVIPLADNRTAISITTARYLTPAKTDINKTGIEPDYRVVLGRDDEIKLLREQLPPEQDKQLQAALAFLKTGTVPADLIAEPSEDPRAKALEAMQSGQP